MGVLPRLGARKMLVVGLKPLKMSGMHGHGPPRLLHVLVQARAMELLAEPERNRGLREVQKAVAQVAALL